MADDENQVDFDEVALERFLFALKEYLARPNAPRKRLSATKEFVDLLTVRRSDDGPVLFLDVQKMGRHSEAYHALKTIHLAGFAFAPREGEPRIRIHDLKRLEGHDFVPVRLKQSSEAEIIVDKGYAKLTKELDRFDKIGQVTMIQHSNNSAAALVTTLLDKGADVSLFIQSHECAIPAAAAGRMKEFYEDVRNRYFDDGGALKIYRYASPASLRAVLIHDEFLWVSWYNYITTSNNPKSGFKILGHNQPCVKCYAGSQAFETLSQMVLDVAESIANQLTPDIVLERGRKNKSPQSNGKALKTTRR